MPATYTLSAADFSRDFDALKGLILSEWPDIEAGALDATDGEVDEVVRVVAEQTDHSRTLVRLREVLAPLHCPRTTPSDALPPRGQRRPDGGER